MDAEAVRGLARTARSFAERFIAPVIEAEGRDGDLETVPDVIDRAGELGITSSPDPSAEGYEHGVWGISSLEDDVLGSLTMLEEIAAVCAGVACCVHAVGLGTGELEGTGIDAARVGVGIQDDAWPVDLLALDRPWPRCAGLSENGGTVSLSGSKEFLWLPPGCEGYVVYAAGERGWERVFIPRTAKCAAVVDSGPRTGLAAVKIVGLRLDDVADPRAPPAPGSSADCAAQAPPARHRRHRGGQRARSAAAAATPQIDTREVGRSRITLRCVSCSARPPRRSKPPRRSCGRPVGGQNGHVGVLRAAAAKLRANGGLLRCGDRLSPDIRRLRLYGRSSAWRNGCGTPSP